MAFHHSLLSSARTFKLTRDVRVAVAPSPVLSSIAPVLSVQGRVHILPSIIDAVQYANKSAYRVLVFQSSQFQVVDGIVSVFRRTPILDTDTSIAKNQSRGMLALFALAGGSSSGGGMVRVQWQSRTVGFANGPVNVSSSNSNSVPCPQPLECR